MTPVHRPSWFARLLAWLRPRPEAVPDKLALSPETRARLLAVGMAAAERRSAMR